MTDTYQLALSDPPSELVNEVAQWSNTLNATFSEEEIYFIARAMAALSKREKHPSIDLNAFVSTTLNTCFAHRDQLALVLSIAQDRYTNGIKS